MPFKYDVVYEEIHVYSDIFEVICRFENYWMFSTSDWKTIPSFFLA